MDCEWLGSGKATLASLRNMLPLWTEACSTQHGRASCIACYTSQAVSQDRCRLCCPIFNNNDPRLSGQRSVCLSALRQRRLTWSWFRNYPPKFFLKPFNALWPIVVFLFSDCWTNFVGASHQLKELYSFLQDSFNGNTLIRALCDQKIT
ncbi:hypothetical protein PR048_009857 [Dryococelus australis]|uniref:Uncharacterized protein n=1 Tax=Dryococelus australis TaxID=614101 RepID=A0ABQ9I226_9NEOP|nr:hypothetical protein PR048_009857 [Dryococelus australis]